MELKSQDIIKILHKFCKNKDVPHEVKEFIEENTNRYGKAKLILQAQKYYIEAEQGVMDDLKNTTSIKEAIERAVFLE